MSHSFSRRQFTRLAGFGLALGLAAPFLRTARAAEGGFDAVLAGIERRFSGRLGVFVIDTATERRWGRRADERFPMCSTFKLMAAAGLLSRVDAGTESLSRRIVIQPTDIVTYSPVTERRVGGEGMTLAEICEAALTQSDNTAGNVLIDALGGPAGVTDFARSIDDDTFRLDRRETELNEARPGDPRDTTSPAAMAKSLAALVQEDALSDASRRQLVEWLVANRTGDAKLRAGLPKTWRIGDKTGGGAFGTMNDVAVIWPEAHRPPIVISVYLTETQASFDDRNAGFAEIGRALADIAKA